MKKSGTKRANGEGSICRRSNGKGWVGSLTLGHDANGKQVRRYVSGDTQAEVREKLDALKRDRDRDEAVPSTPMTLGQFLERWLAHKQRDVRVTTHRDYTLSVRKHITPKLGAVRLEKLTALHVESLVTHLFDQARSEAQTVRCLRVVKMALSQAVIWGLVGRNVAERVKPPKSTKQEMKVWTPEQASKFLAALKGHELYPLYYVALATGMRRGELMGLRWADVDFAREQLTVSRGVVSLSGKPHVSEPKTAAGKRVVTLSPDVLDLLRQYRVTQSGSGELVFGSRTGTFLQPATITRVLLRFTAKAGVPRIRFHDLRHTSASLLIRSNVPIKVVSDRLGHADSGFTMRTYVHVFDDQRRAAALPLGQMLREAGD